MNKTKGDIIWGIILAACIIFLALPVTGHAFMTFTQIHPYLGGFIKFFILATMGDKLGYRIIYGKWSLGKDMLPKAVVWGLLGMVITLMFSIFNFGTIGAQEIGRLPFKGSAIGTAFFTSFIMNITFGPMMYVYHKLADLMVDFTFEKTKINIENLVKRIDWLNMVGFSWAKTCIFVWIPLHTFVFLLSAEYRVLASAFLSILLGILVAISKKSQIKNPQH